MAGEVLGLFEWKDFKEDGCNMQYVLLLDCCPSRSVGEIHYILYQEIVLQNYASASDMVINTYSFHLKKKKSLSELLTHEMR